MLEQKREALIRRANMLIGWLHRDNIQVYSAEHGAGDLTYLIDLIIWSLERSILLTDWPRFRDEFQATKRAINEPADPAAEPAIIYSTAVNVLEATLKEYIVYVQSDKLTMAVE